MPRHTPTVSFVQPKGGVGKTTAAAVVASELMQQLAGKITIIDADPNYPFKNWVQLASERLDLVFDQSEETILDNIARAQASSQAVLIDLEGTKNMRVTYAVSKSDLVVIPVQGSILDANQATEAIKLVKRTGQGFGREIDFVILFTRMPAAIVSRNFSDIAKQFRDAGMPVLDTHLVEREAFKTMFATGHTLYGLTEQHVSGLRKAQQDAYELTKAIIERINASRSRQKDSQPQQAA
jgi:chromosome partitioning protein